MSAESVSGGIGAIGINPKGRIESRTNLSLFYDLTLPGEYTLTVSRSANIGSVAPRKAITLTASGISFKINTPKPDFDP